MNGRVACKKSLLRKVNILKRFKFAKEHVHWTKSNGKKFYSLMKKKYRFSGHTGEPLFDEHQVNVIIMNFSSLL